MPFREKLKAVFQFRSKHRSSKKKNKEPSPSAKETATTTTTTTPPRRPAIKVPKVKPYKPKYDKNGKPIPAVYKPHEIPRSKYRGPFDQAHLDRLAAYSFRLAQRERPRSAVSSFSPTATCTGSRRTSFATGHESLEGGQGEEDEEEESRVELSRPFSQPALDDFLRDESPTENDGADGQSSRPVSSPTFGTQDRSNVLCDNTDIVSYNTSATSITVHGVEYDYSYPGRGSYQITEGMKRTQTPMSGTGRSSVEVPESCSEQRRSKRPGSAVPDVITKSTALRANPMNDSVIFDQQHHSMALST
ncbi:hypothetical protein AAP_05086 [Ascosphaera apis ARSEF 7405]|uniref:Uncharacterized protein n=1 Tax=Ascosphaera apis ARSEF 7405 TaxID=392613 RepID=A0A167W0N9_9EURO|nr:hypothetical protein AAP_05086 [Ascosphaera apis ARSEF 7405]